VGRKVYGRQTGKKEVFKTGDRTRERGREKERVTRELKGRNGGKKRRVD
jgi:hypothetical protein